jgi:hypothetical protein
MPEKQPSSVRSSSTRYGYPRRIAVAVRVLKLLETLIRNDATELRAEACWGESRISSGSLLGKSVRKDKTGALSSSFFLRICSMMKKPVSRTAGGPAR